MESGAIHEEVDPFIHDSSTDVFKHLHECLVGEGVVCLILGEDSVTLADGHADSLTRLLLCSILHAQVLIWVRPSFPLKVSRLEDALIEEHKMTTALHDIMQLLVERDGLILELLNSLLFLCWDVTDFDLLLPQTCLLHNL